MRLLRIFETKPTRNQKHSVGSVFSEPRGLQKEIRRQSGDCPAARYNGGNGRRQSLRRATARPAARRIGGRAGRSRLARRELAGDPQRRRAARPLREVQRPGRRGPAKGQAPMRWTDRSPWRPPSAHAAARRENRSLLVQGASAPQAYCGGVRGFSLCRWRGCDAHFRRWFVRSPCSATTAACLAYGAADDFASGRYRQRVALRATRCTAKNRPRLRLAEESRSRLSGSVSAVCSLCRRPMRRGRKRGSVRLVLTVAPLTPRRRLAVTPRHGVPGLPSSSDAPRRR